MVLGIKTHIGADVNSDAVHTVTTAAANRRRHYAIAQPVTKDWSRHLCRCRVTSAMNVGVARSSWVYAGALMTKVSLVKTSRPARKSATANSPRCEGGWGMFSEWLNNNFVFTSPETRYYRGLEGNTSAGQLADGAGQSLYAQAAADGKWQIKQKSRGNAMY